MRTFHQGPHARVFARSLLAGAWRSAPSTNEDREREFSQRFPQAMPRFYAPPRLSATVRIIRTVAFAAIGAGIAYGLYVIWTL
jgi:hypothetical protein